MPEKIGKYDIIQRIGRGGMGEVFKAHDAGLDRDVALKVISTDADVTDELRARFFREAQACGRLSHPNIVTVYDMGEDRGRLFFVMELLDGEELRGLIVQRKALPLEDKLSALVQVCDGLHYAHAQGVVHRDVKPGNIMLLRNGQVKILDFGIAQVAAALGSRLTRTGLVMGTLRYIAPEQVRGRSDRRSDIYSVGALAYELLSLRAPFTGDDPMRLLEQLRAEDPIPLSELDPTLPPELTAIVERAMRKDPEDRFQGLDEMRAQLAQAQRRLAEEAQQLRARLRSQRDHLRQLGAILTERSGVPSDEDADIALDERASVTTMRALEGEMQQQIRTLEARITEADSLDLALQRGLELMEAGQFADAAAEFEAIVQETPTHERAVELLARARAEAETERRQRLAAQFLKEARAAFEDRQPSLCLEILKQAREVAAPADAGDEFATLWQSAEAAIAAQETSRRMLEHAERAREDAMRRRSLARTAGAGPDAGEPWNAAEAMLARAMTAFDERSFEAAITAFGEAATLFDGAVTAAQERRRLQRRGAEDVRERAAQGAQAAAAMGADRLALTLWNQATARSADGDVAFANEEYVKAADAFEAAHALYRRAESHVREERRRQREEAERGQQLMAERRWGAVGADAARQAASVWSEAELAAASAEATFVRKAYVEASGAFERAAELYRQADQAARQAARTVELARADAQKSREAGALARQAAMRAEAATHAPDEWRLGESAEATASAALSDGDFRTARSLFGEARRHYTAAAQTAGLAAEMKARRVEAMFGDARRLLDAGDLEACRRRLGELEIASPGHAGAELLRREVEARMQAATSAQSTFPSERTDDVGVVTSAIASTPPTVDSPSPPADAVEPPHVDIDDRQRVAAAAPRASPGARRVFDDEPIFPVSESSGESDTGSFSLLDEDLVTAARRSRLRLWVTALVLVAGIALVWVWWSRPVRPKAVPIEPVAVEKAAEATPTSVGSESRGEKPAADVRERRSTSETSAATSAPDRPTDVARREPPARAAQERAGEKAAAVAPVAKKMTASEKSAFEKAAAVAADRLLSDKTAAADSASTLRATTEAAAPERLPGQRAATESASSAKASDDKAGEDRGSEKAAIEWAAAEKQLALLKSTAEEARARTMMRREQAVKADADRFARNLFGLAEGKLAEADAHAKNQTLAAATRAYQEGADRYAQATSQARAVREAKTDADSAKTRMAAQKQRAARRDSPEFQAGLAEEKRAAAFYDQYAFKQAAEHFRTAETLFGRGGAPSPVPQR